MIIPATSASADQPVIPKPGPIIEINDVSHQFGHTGNSDALSALENIDVTVDRGEFVCLVGPSGCGKTTLLHMLAGIIVPTSGSVRINGAPPHPGDRRVGYVPARDSLLPWRTTLDNAALAMEIQGIGKRERHDRARAALTELGLGDFENHYRGQLSHGMRQRVSLARSLATRPEILLMDEPFAALDAQTRLTVQDQFLQLWQSSGMTVVLITHDLSEAVALADRVVMLTRRPGHIKATFDIDLERPRSLFDLQSNDQFHQLYEAVWTEFRTEVLAQSQQGSKAEGT